MGGRGTLHKRLGTLHLVSQPGRLHMPRSRKLCTGSLPSPAPGLCLIIYTWHSCGPAWVVCVETSLTLILPGKAGALVLGGRRMKPHVFSYLHSWTLASVDTATEEQSGQTQGGCYTGTVAVTSLPTPGGGKHRIRSLDIGSHGDASWEQGFLIETPEE